MSVRFGLFIQEEFGTNPVADDEPIFSDLSAYENRNGSRRLRLCILNIARHPMPVLKKNE